MRVFLNSRDIARYIFSLFLVVLLFSPQMASASSEDKSTTKPWEGSGVTIQKVISRVVDSAQNLGLTTGVCSVVGLLIMFVLARTVWMTLIILVMVGVILSGSSIDTVKNLVGEVINTINIAKKLPTNTPDTTPA